MAHGTCRQRYQETICCFCFATASRVGPKLGLRFGVEAGIRNSLALHEVSETAKVDLALCLQCSYVLGEIWTDFHRQVTTPHNTEETWSICACLVLACARVVRVVQDVKEMQRVRNAGAKLIQAISGPLLPVAFAVRHSEAAMSVLSVPCLPAVSMDAGSTKLGPCHGRSSADLVQKIQT